MAGGINNIDMGAVPHHRTVLGEYGDAALFFNVVAVHHTLFNVLVRGESAGLTQQLVDQGGLAVVNVGDDGDIAYGAGHGSSGS